MIRRLALLVLVAAVAAATVFAAELPIIKNWKITIGEIPLASKIDVEPKDLNLVCPGALNLSGGKAGTKLGVFSRLNTALLSTIETPTDGVVFETRSIITDSPSISTPERIVDPISITAIDKTSNAVQGSTLLSANQIQLASELSMAGLAGAACQKPAHEQLLVGGDTSVGREAVLVLANPSAIAANLDMKVYGVSGEVESIGLNGFSVAPGKTQLIQLSSLVPRTKSFALQITGRGGAIAAWIQQKTVRGLSATGVDFISPNAAVAKSQFIPGVLIRGSKSAKKLMKANDDYADLVPTVRVFVPGEKAAKVTVQILGSNSKSFGTVVQQDVLAGRVADIPIQGLSDGDYVAIVSAGVPISASMNISRVNVAKNPVSDFAFLAAAEASLAARAIRVPTSGISKLSLLNASNEPAEVSVTAGDTVTRFNLTDAGSKVIEVQPGAIATVSSDQDIAASLVVDLDGTFTVLPVTNYKNEKEQVLVSVR